MTHDTFFSFATFVMTSQIFYLASTAHADHNCKTTLTNSSGVIYSPNYPADYYDFLDCSWLIVTNEISRISLNFTSLTTECCCDFVTVYDGNTTSAPQLGKLCSLQYNNFTSSGNSLLVTFSTDDSVSKSGFFASYKILKNTKCGPDKYICGNSTRCLPRTVLCDGQRDCPDGDDEDGNVCTRYCNPTDHQCTSGQCIPLQLFCNGTKCKDGSDSPDKSLGMDVQPGVISTGLTINCSSYLLDTSCPDNWKLLTLSRLNKTSQEFEEILRLQVDNKKDLKLISDEQIEDSDVTFGDFFVSLNVHTPQNGDEFRCEASDYDNYSKNTTTQTETYKVVLNTTSAEDEDQENTSTVQPPTVKQFTVSEPTFCESAADVLLILDSSGSISISDYTKLSNFSAELSKNFHIGPDTVRFSAIVFGTSIRNVFSFDSYNNSADVVKALRNIPYLNEFTNTAGALTYARTTSFSTASGARPNVGKIAVVITDGQSDNTDLTAQAAAALKQSGVTIIAVGVGSNIAQTELMAIASSPSNVFSVNDFSVLDAIKKNLVQTACLDMVLDVQPEVTSPGLRQTLKVTCTINHHRRSHLQLVKYLTVSRYNETKNSFNDIFHIDVDNGNTTVHTDRARLIEKDTKFGRLFVGLSVLNPERTEEFKCEGIILNTQFRNFTTLSKIYKVELNITSTGNETVEDKDLPKNETDGITEEAENCSSPQPHTDRHFDQYIDLSFSVHSEQANSGTSDHLEVICRYTKTPSLKIFSMSILQSTTVDKPEFKYLHSVNNLTHENQSFAYGAIDNNESSFIKLTFDDPSLSQLGLYRCEVIGLDVEHGKPVIVSKESLVDTLFEMKMMEMFHNKTLLIQKSIEALQSHLLNDTREILKLETTINQLQDKLNETISELKSDNVKIKNAMFNTTKLNNEFLINLQSLNRTVSGVENDWNDINTKFDNLEQLVNSSHKELENIRNKSISQELVQKRLQPIESSITQQKSLIESVVNKYEAVKKRQDELAAKLAQLESDSQSVLKKSLESLFVLSDPFGGRRYGLTRKSHTILITDAQSLCLKYGGYLVEIDSQDEFNFVRAFVKKYSSLKAVYTGGTDSMKEGVWIQRFSLLTMKATNWYRSEPNNHDYEEHCECFWSNYDYLMNDCKCHLELHVDSGFICEGI